MKIFIKAQGKGKGKRAEAMGKGELKSCDVMKNKGLENFIQVVKGTV